MEQSHKKGLLSRGLGFTGVILVAVSASVSLQVQKGFGLQSQTQSPAEQMLSQGLNPGANALQDLIQSTLEIPHTAAGLLLQYNDHIA